MTRRATDSPGAPGRTTPTARPASRRRWMPTPLLRAMARARPWAQTARRSPSPASRTTVTPSSGRAAPDPSVQAPKPRTVSHPSPRTARRLGARPVRKASGALVGQAPPLPPTGRPRSATGYPSSPSSTTQAGPSGRTRAPTPQRSPEGAVRRMRGRRQPVSRLPESFPPSSHGLRRRNRCHGRVQRCRWRCKRRPLGGGFRVRERPGDTSSGSCAGGPA